MKGSGRNSTSTEYDQVEIDRCMDQVFTLLMEAARERALRKQQACGQQSRPATITNLI